MDFKVIFLTPIHHIHKNWIDLKVQLHCMNPTSMYKLSEILTEQLPITVLIYLKNMYIL